MALATYSGTTAAKEVPSRRQLLKLAPAAGMAALLAGAVPVIAQAQTETPVAVAYREWAVFADIIRNAPDELEDHIFDALIHERCEMEKAMFAIPARTTDDVLLKLLAYSDNGEDIMSDGDDTPETILREGMALMRIAV